MIAFVVLHYLTLSDTVEAVNYIKKNVGCTDYVIIIVDNASPNKTGEKLLEKYRNDDKISVNIQKENLGFANGNNVGFVIAKNKYHADFIVMMNNDVNLVSLDFSGKIKSIYQRRPFAVLGPLILTADGRCDSNPVAKNYRNIEEIKKSIERYKKRLRWLQSGLEPIRLYASSLKKKKYIEERKKDFIDEQENVRLHGSCWIFSPQYIEKYDGIDSGTFMYMEEDILQYHMKNDRMIMLYSPEIVVFHKEAVSTSANITDKQKLLRKYNWLIQSNEYFLKLMQRGE